MSGRDDTSTTDETAGQQNPAAGLLVSLSMSRAGSLPHVPDRKTAETINLTKADSSDNKMNVEASGVVRRLSYPAIDGLRFYAAMLVFIVHFTTMCAASITRMELPTRGSAPQLGLPQFVLWLGDGQHGVDIFFVISGFLMGRMVLAPRGFSYGHFLWKRVLRIYPAFLASEVLAVLAYYLLFGVPFWTWSFLGNLLFLNSIQDLGLYVYNYPTWSLGYEVAFYLIVPVALIFRRLFGAHLATAIMLALAIALIPDAYIRMRGLFVGTLIASFSDVHLRRAGRLLPAPVLLGVYFGVTILKDTYVIGYLAFYDVMIVTVALLFIHIVFSDGLLNRAFRSRPMRFLGTLSYSFYLLHATVLSTVLTTLMPLFGLAGPPTQQVLTFVVLGFTGSLGLAWASYVLFERPYFARHTVLSDQQPGLQPAGAQAGRSRR